jgi:hypothetical protein
LPATAAADFSPRNAAIGPLYVFWYSIGLLNQLPAQLLAKAAMHQAHQQQ